MNVALPDKRERKTRQLFQAASPKRSKSVATRRNKMHTSPYRKIKPHTNMNRESRNSRNRSPLSEKQKRKFLRNSNLRSRTPTKLGTLNDFHLGRHHSAEMARLKKEEQQEIQNEKDRREKEIQNEKDRREKERRRLRAQLTRAQTKQKNAQKALDEARNKAAKIAKEKEDRDKRAKKRVDSKEENVKMNNAVEYAEENLVDASDEVSRLEDLLKSLGFSGGRRKTSKTSKTRKSRK